MTYRLTAPSAATAPASTGSYRNRNSRNTALVTSSMITPTNCSVATVAIWSISWIREVRSPP